eukprot:TRINITY_DN7248_c0_g2_i4.p1 TRINITY_DN7248_c0_g2~~TRINITY_DN7248_c0_g2_i4.p1  ORF type:complete len:138 (+),score=27.02 TRINITY_DN7248_c0_g2_i4:68-481(+)
MSGNQGVLVFLVGQKNALRVVQYIREHFKEISQLKVLVTLTEGKELEGLVGSGDWLSYVASLKDGGAAEIARRCGKNQVLAVFVLNPGDLIQAKIFTAEKMQELIEACWNSDTHICFNKKMMDLMLQQLTTKLRGNL